MCVYVCVCVCVFRLFCRCFVFAFCDLVGVGSQQSTHSACVGLLAGVPIKSLIGRSEPAKTLIQWLEEGVFEGCYSFPKREV
jgi:hypothetical protein